MTIWERFSSRVRDAMDTPGGPGSRGTGPAAIGLADKLGLTRGASSVALLQLHGRRERPLPRPNHPLPGSPGLGAGASDLRERGLFGSAISALIEARIALSLDRLGWPRARAIFERGAFRKRDA